MQKELFRLSNYLKDFPDIEIWVVSKNSVIAKAYWDSINEHIETKKKPIFISKKNYYKDGYGTFNAVILLCGHWYENPIAFSEVFRMRLEEAKFILPIGELPEPKILNEIRGDNDMDAIIIFIGDRTIVAKGKVIVTYTSNKEFTYEPKEVSQLYLNESTIIDIQVLRNVE